MAVRPSPFTLLYLKPRFNTVLSARLIHNSAQDKASFSASNPDTVSDTSSLLKHFPPTAPTAPPLSCLPLSQIIRTWLITSVSSSPRLLTACSSLLMSMLNSQSAFTSVERNPILRLLLRETFYKQFCGGATRADVQKTMKQMHDTGYSGLILEYALEVLKDAKSSGEAKDVEVWRKGMLASVDMASAGDFVGLKWSGLGPDALQLLKANKPPSPLMDKAMREVCKTAAAKGVRLLPAAEEMTTTPTYHEWTLNLQRQFNKAPNSIVMYNTYQAYLKQTPITLAKHLHSAQSEGFTLGIKLVRGAYLWSEPRHLIWSSKEGTDEAYDSLTAALIRRQYTGMLEPSPSADTQTFPEIDVVLATHNAASVRKAQAIRTEQTQQHQPKIPLVYAQLHGMADEVSCELIQAGKANSSDRQLVDVPKTYKCTTWGSMTECLNYLLRRAAENKDAAMRTSESRAAMAGEIRRRVKASVGLP